MKKIVNGIPVDLTTEEQIEYDQREAEWNAQIPIRMLAQFTESLEKLVTDNVIAKGYASALSCASYALSTNPQWAEEAAAFIAWRDAVYVYGFDYQARVQSGEITNPSIESLLAGAPDLVWPTV